MAASATRSQHLAHFKRILREVHLQYTHPKEFTGKGLHGINIHANKIWIGALKDAFRKHANETDPTKLKKLHTDGEDLATYLETQRKHKDLIERYNPAYWDEEKDFQLEKTAQMVGFEMPENFDESQRDKAWVSPPKFTYKDKTVAQKASTSYEELKAPKEPRRRTYKIPKAFGFAEQAEDDLGRAGDRKIE
ncbi:hypothetical protein BGZ65_001194 [Modicella reniformis]|uniref:Uncharacterized protein n=1 Tax=Modicella reniformis TaxID=1440133 RepID=A0A9P6SUN7_9FUNG|nr:hypothetical protein BGZ65_001194 [Modicella reniformis]